jgi:dephospho-CoA kinase
MTQKKVAITGGIGSGKSLALRYISQIGYPVYSCDEIYKTVIKSKEYIDKVSALFPDVIVDGNISRELLAKQVFNNIENRMKINQIAHPMIMQTLYAQMAKCESTLIFAEVPLLFEGNFEKDFDNILYIYRSKEKRIESIIARDGLSRVDAENRIAVQFNPDSLEGQKRLNDVQAHIIENNGSCDELYQKILNYIDIMKQQL